MSWQADLYALNDENLDLTLCVWFFFVYFLSFPTIIVLLALPIELDWAQTEKGQEHPPSP